MAIAFTLHEFLDKSRTKSHWHRHLDRINVHQSSRINAEEKKIRQQMIQYAVNDCLAVTKLVMVFEFGGTQDKL